MLSSLLNERDDVVPPIHLYSQPTSRLYTINIDIATKAGVTACFCMKQYRTVKSDFFDGVMF